MAKLVWARPARDHLRSIVDYVAKDSRVAAARLYAKILDAPKRLARFPRSGGIVPEFGDEAIREIYCGLYRIVYWIQDDECRIVAVIHGSRDFLSAIDRDEWEVD
jgi:toxin ParE1/3/4